jgi:aminobenzoyl-glutamate utilization protein B
MKRSYAVAIATAIVFCLYGTGLLADLSTESQVKLMKSVDSYASRMSEVALKIWSAPELGYLETQTSALLQDELKKAGFKIEAGVAGIPTAFVARNVASRGAGA